MKNLKNLKGNELYKGISITEDYKVAEREMIRKMSEEIKTQNSQELPNSKYVYKLRGTPKHGLQMKRFLKRVAN